MTPLESLKESFKVLLMEKGEVNKIFDTNRENNKSIKQVLGPVTHIDHKL